MVRLIKWSTLMVFMLVSCGGEEPAKDVAYYLKHPEERQQKRQLCQKQLEVKLAQYVKEGKKDISPTDIEPSANCKNAEEAEQQHIVASFEKDSDSKPSENSLSSIKTDLDHFLKDDAARQKAIDQCERNQLYLKGSKYCNNAQEAEKIKHDTVKK